MVFQRFRIGLAVRHAERMVRWYTQRARNHRQEKCFHAQAEAAYTGLAFHWEAEVKRLRAKLVKALPEPLVKRLEA